MNNKYLKFEFDESTGSLFCFFENTVFFSFGLFKESLAILKSVVNNEGYYNGHQLNFFILSSNIQNIWNFGGDLEVFVDCINNDNEEKLQEYADLSYECFFYVHKLKEMGIGTFSLINGDAFGGGLETALMFDYVFAEEHVKLAFPEIKFNLFPGMGAFTFLKRRINSHKIMEIILSGKRYTANDFKEIGVVNDVFEESTGLSEIKKIIADYHSNLNSYKKIISINAKYKLGSEKEEFREIVDEWVKSCMQNTDVAKLNLMKKIYLAQKKKADKIIAFGMNT